MRVFTFIVCLFVCVGAAAQGQKTRPATETDFTGYWRVVLIPNEVHGSAYKNEQMGYADPCQFLVHKPDGTWFNISVTNMAGAEESRRQCLTKQAGATLPCLPNHNHRSDGANCRIKTVFSLSGIRLLGQIQRNQWRFYGKLTMY